MNALLPLAAAVVAIAVGFSTAYGQNVPTPACPDGISISVQHAGEGDPVVEDTAAVGAQGAAVPRGVSVLDTTFVVAVQDRRWTWRNMVASLGVGISVAKPRPVQVCAGATIFMRQATLVVRNASGSVHLRADVTPLRGLVNRTAGPPGA